MPSRLVRPALVRYIQPVSPNGGGGGGVGCWFGDGTGTVARRHRMAVNSHVGEGGGRRYLICVTGSIRTIALVTERAICYHGWIELKVAESTRRRHRRPTSFVIRHSSIRQQEYVHGAKTGRQCSGRRQS